MRLILIAVGRSRNVPERPLLDDYLTRVNAMCRPLGLKSLEMIEVEDRKAGSKPAQGLKDREAELILGAVPPGARLIALDEHGRNWTSKHLAGEMAKWRDAGVSDCAFIIGGADGLAPAVLERADTKLAFGAATWPHMLVRTMLTEQIYRAATILAGHPYHRE